MTHVRYTRDSPRLPKPGGEHCGAGIPWKSARTYLVPSTLSPAMARAGRQIASRIQSNSGSGTSTWKPGCSASAARAAAFRTSLARPGK